MTFRLIPFFSTRMALLLSLIVSEKIRRRGRKHTGMRRYASIDQQRISIIDASCQTVCELHSKQCRNKSQGHYHLILCIFSPPIPVQDTIPDKQVWTCLSGIVFIYDTAKWLHYYHYYCNYRYFYM